MIRYAVSFAIYDPSSHGCVMPQTKRPEFLKLFPKNYWDRPPLRNHGDPQASQTYMAVGLALSRWETLEDQFADLFSVLLQGQYDAAKQVYGSIQTSHGRREALRHAAESVFRDIHATDQQRDTFDQLVHNFGLASGRRDDIAHALVMGFQIDSENRGCFLVPPRYNSERNHLFYERPPDDEIFSTAKYRYVASDVAAVVEKFSALGMQVTTFTKQIAAQINKARAADRR